MNEKKVVVKTVEAKCSQCRCKHFFTGSSTQSDKDAQAKARIRAASRGWYFDYDAIYCPACSIEVLGGDKGDKNESNDCLGR